MRRFMAVTSQLCGARYSLTNHQVYDSVSLLVLWNDWPWLRPASPVTRLNLGFGFALRMA